MHGDVSLLTCGTAEISVSETSELAEMLSYIRETTELVLTQLSWLSTQGPEQISMFGPFLGRSLLELSTTALIGRLDPLRLLVVRQIQNQPHYDTSVRWKASIQWQGDVLAGEKSKDLWNDKLDYERVSKAILGDPIDQLVWRPAFLRMRAASPAGGAWMAQLAGIEAEAFVARKREEINRLYSTLSKGIHHEFVMRPGALYDRATVVDLVQRSVYAVASMGLISHYIPHVPFSLGAKKAVEAFNRIENAEIIK
jgi:hypothetical protein